MPTVSESAKAVKRYVVAATPHKYPGLMCIVGPGTNAIRWYHAGEAEIVTHLGIWDAETNPSGDPSTRRKRDRAGLSNAGSALDFSFRDAQSKRYTKAAQKAQIEFTAFLHEYAQAGTVDLFQVLGPDAQLRPSFWGKPTWRRYPASKSHASHTHVSIPRDTEFADRLALLDLVTFFDGWQPMAGPIPPDDDPPLPGTEPGQPVLPEEEADPTYDELLAMIDERDDKIAAAQAALED